MLVNELLYEGVYDPHIFKAVFMAGSPGAGKSTAAGMLFNGTGLRPLNVDNFWALYKKLGKQGDYERYWELFKEQEKNLLAGRIGVLIDGTAKNPEKMNLLKKNLEGLGYDTAMVFVNTELDISQQRVKTRAEKIGREIDPSFVQTTWELVQKNSEILRNMFGDNFYLVNNNGNLNDLKQNISTVERPIRYWLNQRPQRAQAKEWIQQQLTAKSRNPARDQDTN